MLFSLLRFLLFLVIFVLLPAKVILSGYFKIKDSDPISDLALNLIFGITLLILFMIVIQLLNLPFYLIYIFPLFVILKLKYLKKTQSDLQISKISFFSLLLFFGFALIQSYPLLNGGNIGPNGIYFPSLHDNLWNISIINQLNIAFPPFHPAISNETLKNHHYFYLYFLTLIHKTTNIGIFELYFRFGTVLVSFLFGISIYLVSTIFTKNMNFKILSVFFGIFSGNFAYLAPFFFKNISDWRANLFFADQPFDQIFNPYTVFGYAVFLVSIYCVFNYLRSAKPNTNWQVLSAILIAVTYGIKSFACVILMIALFLISFISVVFLNQFKPLKLLALTIIILIPFFLLVSGSKSVSLIFFPGWLLTEMMIGKDKLNLPQFIAIENYYLQIGNWLGLLKLKIIELLIYLIGNLGVRILGMFFIAKTIFSFKYDQKNLIFRIYILILILVSLALPLLFNLSTSPHNIIQFTPFSLLLLAILSAFFLEDLIKQKSIRKYKLIPILIIILIVSLAIPVNVKNFIQKLRSEKGDIINLEELEALKYIENNNDGIILINPDEFDRSPIYISALAKKSVYLADKNFALQTAISPEERIKKIKLFFENGMMDFNFLKNNNIRYIYLLKRKTKVNRNLFENDLPVKYKILKENNSVLLLEVNS